MVVLMSDNNDILTVLENWEFVKCLPTKIEDFELAVDVKKVNDEVDIFSYEDKKQKKKIRCYYNCATKDYMIKRMFGLNNYCEMEFITPKLEDFERILAEKLEQYVALLAEFKRENVSTILLDKGLLDWQYGKSLPESIMDFELYIRPFEPMRLINGSVVLIDYSDFNTLKQLVVYYNILRDEFYAEKKINGVVYTLAGFEAKSLKELESVLAEKLEKSLVELTS